MQTRASVRTRCEKSVWALDFALPRGVPRSDRGRKKRGRERESENESETTGWLGEGEGVLSGEEAEESSSVNERERVRMRTSADDAKYRAGGAECAAAHLS